MDVSLALAAGLSARYSSAEKDWLGRKTTMPGTHRGGIGGSDDACLRGGGNIADPHGREQFRVIEGGKSQFARSRTHCSVFMLASKSENIRNLFFGLFIRISAADRPSLVVNAHHLRRASGPGMPKLRRHPPPISVLLSCGGFKAERRIVSSKAKWSRRNVAGPAHIEKSPWIGNHWPQ
jgi:hypothetical protein